MAFANTLQGLAWRHQKQKQQVTRQNVGESWPFIKIESWYQRIPRVLRFFDIIEDAPIKDKSGEGILLSLEWLKQLFLNRNNFKITKAIPASFGVKFEVQTSVDYVKLGFAPKYDIVIWPGCFSIATFIQFMFEDAAKAGVYEFIRVVTEYCSVQVDEEIFHYYKSLTVSYEVIELLLEHQELIGMLANFSVKLQCNDKRIKPEEIANFRRVINPPRRRWIELNKNIQKFQSEYMYKYWNQAFCIIDCIPWDVQKVIL